MLLMPALQLRDPVTALIHVEVHDLAGDPGRRRAHGLHTYILRAFGEQVRASLLERGRQTRKQFVEAARQLFQSAEEVLTTGGVAGDFCPMSSTAA